MKSCFYKGQPLKLGDFTYNLFFHLNLFKNNALIYGFGNHLPQIENNVKLFVPVFYK